MNDMFKSIQSIDRMKKMLMPMDSVLATTSVVQQFNGGAMGNAIRAANSIPYSVKSASDILNKTGMGAAALQSSILTPEIRKFKQDFGINSSTAIDTYVHNFKSNWESIFECSDIIQRSISAQNVAMIKWFPNYQKYDLPYGVKSVVRNLSTDAAKSLTQTDNIMFDTSDRTFYHVDEPENKVNAREITILESSIELFAEFSIDELVKFTTLLFQDPFFGIEYPVGKRIFEIIQNWSDFVDFECDTYYHARSINGGVYTELEMRKAPVNVSAHGRYNGVGNSCFYFTEQKDGAIREIRKHGGKKKSIQIAEMKPKKEIRMIDLSQKDISPDNNFMQFIRAAAEENNHVIKREYLLPNFVAACCKRVGIEGIKYYGNGYNCYVTWRDDYFDFISYDIIKPLQDV